MKRAGLGGLLAALVLVAVLVHGLPASAVAIEYGHSRITGTVTTDGSTPLFNVYIVAYRSDGLGGWSPYSGAQSHRDGSYDISGLLAGTYRIYYNPVEDEYPDKWHTEKSSLYLADDIVIGPASTISDVDANMEAGHIAGRAINGSGDGVAGVTVSAYEDNGAGGWAKVSEALTGAGGYYDVGVLRTGVHRLMFETSPDYLGVAFGGGDSVWSELAVDIPVTAGTTTAGNNIILSPAGHIIGQATNDGSTGIPNVEVRLYERDGASLYDRGVTRTDGAGNYAFGGLRTGAYYAAFTGGGFTNNYYDNQPDLESATLISVTEDSTSVANAQLTSARIRGTVTAYGSSGVEGIDVRVYLYRDGGIWNTWSGRTAADGTYDVVGLPQLQPGETFRVAFCDIDGGYDGGHWSPQYYPNSSAVETADDIVVDSGHTISNIDAQLAAGTLQGHVTSDGSAGIPDVGVWAISGWLDSGHVAAYTETGADGSYSFACLAPDSYKLQFEDGGGVYRGEYSGDTTDGASAAPVSVIHGGVQTYDAVLSEFGHITGRVTSDGTAGLEGIQVIAWTPYPGGGWLTRHATTAPDGTYDVAGLAPGEYRVSFNTQYGSRHDYCWYPAMPDRDSANDISVSMGGTTPGIDAVLGEIGHIAGTVTDGTTAIDQVMVTAYALDGSWAGGNYTDETGAYEIHVPDGPYRVEFKDESAWNDGVFMTEWYADAKAQASATQLAVTNAATVTVDAQLAREARITGTVRSPEATPLSGISVSAWPSTFGSSNHWDTTAPDGSYELHGLEAETYRVSFFDTSGTYFSEWYDDAEHNGLATELVMAGGDIASGIDATLTTGGHITGRVTTDGTTPMGNVVVYAYKLDQYGKWSYTGASDGTEADGTYDIPRLQTGTYRVRFYEYDQVRATEWYDDAAGPGTATDVDVTTGATSPGVDAVLGLAGSVTGTVTAQGAGALGGSWVYAYVPNGSGGWDNVAQASTDASGTYRITGLRPGDYRIEFVEKAPYLGEYYDDMGSPDTAQGVTVVAGQNTPGISAELNLRSHISGRVTYDGENGIAGIRVRAEKPNGSGGWSLVSDAYTDADGGYVISEVGPGVYRVVFEGDSTYVGEYYNDVYDAEQAAVVTVLRGYDTTGVDAVLAERGHIAGFVSHDGVNGIEDVLVSAYAKNGYGWWDYVGHAYTQADGAYDIPGLLPDTYRVEFQDPMGFYATEWFDGRADVYSATDVTVTAGSTTLAIDAILSAPSSIAGTVTAGGTPLGSAIVRAYLADDTGGWELTASAMTGPDGSYEISPLAAGSYRVEFVGRDGYLTEWFTDAPWASSADTVTLTGGVPAEGISADLEEAGSIAGSVTTTSHVGIEGVSVFAYTFDDASGLWSQVGYAESSASGSYTISELRAGSYRIEFSGTGAFVGEFYNDRASLATADSVTVTGGATTDAIDAILEATGSLSGTVTNGVDGLPSVWVSVYRSNGDGWTYVGGASSGTDGAYTVTGLTAGTYRVRFYAPDPYLSECWSDAGTLDDADDVVVVGGADTSGIDEVLVEGGHVAGRVTSDGTTGIGGLQVVVWRGSVADGWTFVDSDATLTDGSYDIGGLATGTYVLQFVGSTVYAGEFHSDKLSLSSADPVSVTAGTVTNIDATLAAVSHIMGRVTSDGTVGIQGVTVAAYAPSEFGWAQVGSATTGLDGSYDISGLAAGAYRVGYVDFAEDYLTEYHPNQSTIESATPVLIGSGGTASGIDAVLERAGSLSGTVRSESSAPASGATVRVYAHTATGGWSWVDQGTALADGTYAVRGLRAGTYRVAFDHDLYVEEYYDDAAGLATADDVAVSSGQDTGGIDATLSPGAVISGTVTSDGTTGIENVMACVYRSNTQVGWGLTGADGSYAVTGLSAGTYTVEFWASGTGYAGEWYDNKAWQAQASLISVAAGETKPGIDAVLAQDGHVTGRVTRDGINGLEGIYVELLRSDDLGGWIPVGSCYTGTDGTYLTDGLNPGSYRVKFVDENSEYATQYYAGAADVLAAQSVTVSESATTDAVDAQLVLGGHIKGTVTSDGIHGIAGLWVGALTPSGMGGWEWGNSGTTGADGSYQIDGLSAGAYPVFFFDPDGVYGFRLYGDTSTLAEADRVALGSGETTAGIDALLAPASTIVGRVSSDSAPVADIDVAAYVPDGAGGWFNVAWSTTGADGTYSLGGLSQGTYRVRFTDYNDGRPEVCYANSADLDGATPVAVETGATMPGIDIDYATGSANDAPVAGNDSASVAEDGILSATPGDGVLANDSDPEDDPLTAVLEETAGNGELALASSGAYTYTPDADFNGTDTFTYRAFDGDKHSAVATVTITVTPVNDAPVAGNDSASVAEDGVLSATPGDGVLANDGDPEDDPLTAVLEETAGNGELALAPSGAYTYTPNADFNGTDTFTYRAFDGDKHSAVATVTITVTSPNTPPVSADDAAVVAEDGVLSVGVGSGVLVNDSDTDGDQLAAVLAGATAHGTLSLASDGSYSYRPSANWYGTDTFTYRAFDGEGYSSVATVTITVMPVNDVPVAVDDSASMNEDSALYVPAAQGVLRNDSDVDSGVLVAHLVTGTAHGSLTLNTDGSYAYTPAVDWSGTDTFTYVASDGAGSSAAVTVRITVNDVAETPTALVRTSAATAQLSVGAAHTFTGALSVAPPGSPVVLESSTDGVNFSGTGMTTPAGSGGVVSFTVVPTEKTWYRARFVGDSTFAGSVSDAAVITVKAWVRTPIAPLTMKKSGYYTVYGYLKPQHAAGSKPVKILKWKKTSTGKWKSYGYVWAKASNYSSYSKYSIKMRLPYAGKWRLRAYAPADAQHVGAYSGGYDYVTVK